MTKQEAVKTKEELKVMGAQAKVQWYRDEGEKRDAEDKRSKRTFGDAKGSVVQKSENSNLLDNQVKFETFEDFAIRQIGLKRCENEAGAVPLWIAACGAPGSQVVQKHGRFSCHSVENGLVEF